MKTKLYKPWGKSISINLYDCDIKKISDPKNITQFIKEVIEIVNMVAHGPCYIERFGQGNLEGYSAMQFIETSSITVHCDEPGCRCFIDIFSCKDFNGNKVEKFSKKYFRAKTISASFLIR